MTQENCPKCGSPLSEVTTTSTGKKIQRCSQGSWNSETKQTEGCDYIKWFKDEPMEISEKCPKCGNNLLLATTSTGKKLKKCSTAGWDAESKKATGCDYVEWLGGTTQEINEVCPQCGSKLVIFTTNSGKQLKKCSTSGWDKEKRQATGCTYTQWL